MNTKLIISAVSFSLLTGGAALKAEAKMEDKIKTVNVQKLVMESEPGKEAVEKLQKLQQAKEAEFQQLAADMKRLQSELEKARTDFMAKRSLMRKRLEILNAKSKN